MNKIKLLILSAILTLTINKSNSMNQTTNTHLRIDIHSRIANITTNKDGSTTTTLEDGTIITHQSNGDILVKDREGIFRLLTYRDNRPDSLPEEPDPISLLAFKF